MIHYEIINPHNQSPAPNIIEAGLKHAEQTLHFEANYFVSIELVTPTEIQELNQALRGVDKPTDCLSFSTQDRAVGEQIVHHHPNGALNFALRNERANEAKPWPILGQLILCLDIITQNAQEARQPVERELEWVIEHGILHMVGYHHDSD